MPVIDLGRVIGPQGPQGDTGAQGIRGEQGLPGPNQVTNSTATPLTGVLTGNGSIVGVESIDEAPTADSTGFARSGGTDKAIKGRVPVYGKGKNLLRNWYFVGGGTGHGVFPVNQRGQSSYAGSVYGISGWASNYTSASGSETLNQSYMTLASTGAASYSKRQYVDIQSSGLSGKAITVSVLTDNGLFTQTLTDITVPSSRTRIINLAIEDVGSLELYVASSVRPELFLVAKANKSVNLIACGMEYGTEQTLCHNEGTDANPVWVLNDVPDYEYELYRCMTSTADPNDTFANKSLATQEQLAPIEWGTTASVRHRVGEYFCFGGLLYKCTVEIPANGPITPGANCTPSPDGGINNVSIGLDISSSITPSTGVVISKALLIGRMVYISGSIPKITSASTSATYANMSKYKPWGSTALGNLVFASSGDFGYGQIYVTTAGAIQAIYSKTTTYGLYFTICYYTDDV